MGGSHGILKDHEWTHHAGDCSGLHREATMPGGSFDSALTIPYGGCSDIQFDKLTIRNDGTGE